MRSALSRRVFLERAICASSTAYASLYLSGCPGDEAATEQLISDPPKSPEVAVTTGRSFETWKRLRLGAGGFVTGISISDDGTKVIRTDTHNGYIWDEKAQIWKELFTRINLPDGDVPFPSYLSDQSSAGRSDGPGCWEIAISKKIPRSFMGFGMHGATAAMTAV